MLTREEALALKASDPREFDRRVLSERKQFVFGVRDLRREFGRDWGGEFRVFVNHNLVLHFVPRFNETMQDESELPQFAVFPDDSRDGEERRHWYEGGKDLDPYEGVIFFVTRQRYAAMVAELISVFEDYADYPRLPDTLFPGSVLVRLLSEKVLENPVVRAEREHDFTKFTF